MHLGFLRRLTAAFLALAFLGFSAEPLIADVHDGDAPQAQVEALDVLAELTVSTGSASAETPVSDKSNEPSGHSAHVCHCVHAHGGLQGVEGTRSFPSMPALQVRGASELVPPSALVEPRTRPPQA